jgi:hypothetical protein
MANTTVVLRGVIPDTGPPTVARARPKPLTMAPRVAEPRG